MSNPIITPNSARNHSPHQQSEIDQRAVRMRCVSRANRCSTHSRRGFSLIELLVCIAIIAVMLSMVLPAIQAARESARATYCRSNLAQIGEAFHSYHMTHGSLPSGSVDLQSPVTGGLDRFAWGWALQLLPQLGEQNRAAALNASLGVEDPANRSVLEQTPQNFICPSKSKMGIIGYAGCHNDQSAPIQLDNNGALTLNSHVKYEELVDGLHQTILLGEATDVRWADGTSGSLRNFGTGFGMPYVKTYAGISSSEAEERTKKHFKRVENELALENKPVDSEGENSDTVEPWTAAQEEYLMDDPGEPSSEDPESVVPPPEDDPVVQQIRKTGFWATHRDAGHFLLADGAVRVVSRSVNLEVLRRLANRLDHQPAGDF